MRFLFVLEALEIGGAERQALHLAEYLRAQHGAYVEFWGFDKPGKLSEICQSKSIPWRVIPYVDTSSRFRHLLGVLGFIRELRKGRFDVLVPYTTTPNLYCGISWRFSGARLCVWNQRDLFPLQTGNPLVRIAPRCVPHFIANSLPVATFLKEHLKIPPTKIHTIPNGVALPPPVHTRPQWRERLGMDPSAMAACMVANLHRAKDHETLISAWNAVAKHFKSLQQEIPILVLAGRKDPHSIILSALAEKLGVAPHIRLPGGVDDISGLLSAVDVGVFSSKAEGCPNGILECMASGLSVAATDLPEIRGILPPEQHPFLSPRGDSATLAKNIIALLSDPDRRSSLGTVNQQSASEKFSVERMCRDTSAILREAR